VFVLVNARSASAPCHSYIRNKNLYGSHSPQPPLDTMSCKIPYSNYLIMDIRLFKCEGSTLRFFQTIKHIQGRPQAQGMKYSSVGILVVATPFKCKTSNSSMIRQEMAFSDFTSYPPSYLAKPLRLISELSHSLRSGQWLRHHRTDGWESKNRVQSTPWSLGGYTPRFLPCFKCDEAPAGISIATYAYQPLFTDFTEL
jgi:hypothetical protein